MQMVFVVPRHGRFGIGGKADPPHWQNVGFDPLPHDRLMMPVLAADVAHHGGVEQSAEGRAVVFQQGGDDRLPSGGGVLLAAGPQFVQRGGRDPLAGPNPSTPGCCSKRSASGKSPASTARTRLSICSRFERTPS
jgi:hypothetical protein